MTEENHIHHVQEEVYEGIEPAQDPDVLQPVQPSEGGAEPFQLNGEDPVQEQPQPNPNAIDCLTFFVVVVGKDGNVWPELDITKSFSGERPPNPNDVGPAAGAVFADWQAQKASMYTISQQMQMAQQMQQQMAAQQILQQTQGGRGPGPEVPNRYGRRHG